MKSINSILRIRLARGSVFLPLALLSFSAGQLVVADSFESAVPSAVERLWIGPEYWANPLEDWRISNGRIECINNRGNRNVHLLTHQLAERRGDLAMTVNVGAFGDGAANDRQSWAGFRIGIHESIVDYRRNLLFGEGLDAGMTLKGVLFIGGPPAGGAPTDRGSAIRSAGGVKLRLRATPAGNGYTVTLDAVDVSSGEVRDSVSRENVRGERLRGNLALVCDSGERGRRRRGISKPAGLAPAGSRAAFWFRDWKVAGSKVAGKPDQTFGPILWAMHTLSRGVLKVTAQMPPLGKGDSQVVRLEIQRGGSKEWETLGEERIHPLARTATFRVESWNDDVDTPYRLVYSLTLAASSTQDHFWRGTVRRDPVDKDEITVAGFTGNTDAGFPNDRIARNVAIHDPDVLFFSGDQIYESVGGYGIYREPVDLAVLSYLRKWYLFGWAFRDLLRDRPALCLPDDHDVFQGNIWGEGGRRVAHIRDHPRGGYRQHRDFVNAVQRTQTSHHPAPFDPTPIEQGIEVYYGDMVYGRISFAVLEDRKFKSGPQGKVNSWKGRPDHVRDPDYEPASVDKPGLVLLGERQLEFLRHWAADWRGADMKVACSQTIFANVANYHGANRQYLVADLDSNGWPQAGRNRALRELRRGFALLYAGDQHLPSIVHHGVDDWGDAGYSFCVPSIAAGYPRAWWPQEEGKIGKNRQPGWPEYAGEFRDGFGNKITVLAVGNPEKKQRAAPLEKLHDKASGYGLVRFNKPTRKMTLECWRLLVDVANPKPADQFPGWPVTIHLMENYGRKPTAYLPTLEIEGRKDPVVQVIDERTGETVYTLRIAGSSFRPGVFDASGTYTVRVGEQETGDMKTIPGVRPVKDGKLAVKF